MLRYLADENLNNHDVRALRLRDSKIDIVTVQEVGLGVPTIRQCSRGRPSRVASW